MMACCVNRGFIGTFLKSPSNFYSNLSNIFSPLLLFSLFTATTHMIKVDQPAAVVAHLTVEDMELVADPAMVEAAAVVATEEGMELVVPVVAVTVSTMPTFPVKISPPISPNLKRISTLNILLSPLALMLKSHNTAKNVISIPKVKVSLNQ